ncbi:MAG TPA: carboxylesterase family protein [Povalibacter sp.]|uniref:carboxylesterase/lipase family protein n=1 Tax=Povalibacter sp. TaxID=1962978 RepID=UPI002CD47ED2|nr:carboxylesterase family protein [Povalibacter sp.]HMN46380.1 carboxylesterase family protein [Povalibacter sp.]
MKQRRLWLILLAAVLAIPVALTAAVFIWSRRPPPPLVPGPVVQLRDGAVQGAVVDDVVVYRGIPFAAAPVGDLRWRAPQPAPSWSGVLQATAFKPACMQPGTPIPGMARGAISEDCLYLNLWTPKSSGTKKLPVIVFLHGGGNIDGSASPRPYWGDGLVRHGVVTVNLSYRLGVLGWLAHPDLTREASYHTSGNYALLDMIAGLRWVRDNIAAFGGDPDNVTLMGHSAGAFSASRLMTSPLAEGLFHRVIGESGGDFHPGGSPGGNAFLAEAEQAGIELAHSFGASSIHELRQLPAAKIIETPLPDVWRRLPIIDGYAVLTDSQESYRQGRQHKVPILVGYNEFEGANIDEAAPATAAAFTSRVRARYGTLTPRVLEMFPAETDEEAVRSFVRLKGEEAINWNVATWARLHGMTGSSDVYVYYFTKQPPFGLLRKMGAAHGAELPYVFGTVPGWMRVFTQWPWKARQDLALARQSPAYWTNFARTGNPNGDDLPPWPAFNRHRQVQYLAEDGTRPGPLPHQDEHQLMDEHLNPQP